MSNDLVVGLADIAKLADDFDRAADRIVSAVEPVIKRGAQNIKTDTVNRLRVILSGGGYARRGGRTVLHASTARAYARSITYDTRNEATAVVAEIGPDKSRKQGALGNLIEYGSANNAPLPHLRPAADAEIPKTQAQLLRVAVKAVLSDG